MECVWSQVSDLACDAVWLCRCASKVCAWATHLTQRMGAPLSESPSLSA